MLVLEPISKRRIWGTKRLHQFSGDPNIEKVGSVFTVSAIKEMSNLILNGEYAGENLYDLVTKNRSLFGLKEGEDFPIIVSITGADDDLSIQVHPTDEYAVETEKTPYGKTESWYFLEAPDKGWIYAGAKMEDKKAIKEKMEEGKFEDVVGTLPVNQWDYVTIPSGALHALTKGAIVYEIQQSTDITYRFYDYDRTDVTGAKRELHLEKAIATLDSSKEPTMKDFPDNQWVEDKPYKVFRTDLDGEYQNSEAIAQTLTVIEGTLIIDNQTIQQGSSIVVLPGEKLPIQQSAKVIIATPNLYWRR